ncbi:pr40 [rat cytomegalovirus strain Maastricht]|uniref:Pr40 n=1 Tax=Rat cytomegalovirus (strain Maastricht) TaxID=79700 RepID=Q9DWF1_RCMVM|nr:pr40 [rat cytomegalovirus strain Maastricht]AAF99138.1 pr40 [rat cytomegalovirus strain Maastricht]WEG71965.1 protein m40 [Murid betaherpesvirus 2]
MSDRRADGDALEVFSEDMGSDDEITLFPDSASVAGASERTVPLLRRAAAGDGGLTFYGNGSRGRLPHSDLGEVWRRAEAVFYFSAAVVAFVVLAFLLYFAYTYVTVVRRGHNATRGDRTGARWTRLTERPE